MADGLRVRFARVPGETPKGLLPEPIWLQAALTPIQQQAKATFTDYPTIGAGDFSFPQGGGKNERQLRAWSSVPTLILWWNASWLVQSGQNPNHLRRTLFEILDSRRPVEMLMTAPAGSTMFTEVRSHITFRELDEEIREEPDTRYYTLQLSEWRDPRQRRKGTKPGLPTTHVLKRGDTLYSLSHQYYGTYTLWRHIRDANRISKRIGAKTTIVGHTHFKVGDKLKIPAKPKGAVSKWPRQLQG